MYLSLHKSQLHTRISSRQGSQILCGLKDHKLMQKQAHDQLTLKQKKKTWKCAVSTLPLSIYLQFWPWSAPNRKQFSCRTTKSNLWKIRFEWITLCIYFKYLENCWIWFSILIFKGTSFCCIIHDKIFDYDFCVLWITA